MIGQFVEEVLTEGGPSRLAEVYDLFTAWARDHNVSEPIGRGAFKGRMVAAGVHLGWAEDNGRWQQVYDGVQISDEWLLGQRHHGLALCEVCPLRGEKTYVPSVIGDNDAIIVSEAPDWQDIRAGFPMQGQPGQVFMDAVRKSGTQGLLGKAAVTFLACCRPRKKGAKPTVQAFEACRPRLDADLEGKSVIVALGKTPGVTFTGRTAPLSDLRLGPPADVDGRRVLVTHHPGAVQRSPRWGANLIKDLGKLAHEMPAWVDPEIVVPETVDECLVELRRMWSDGEILTLDIECTQMPAQADGSIKTVKPKRLRCIGLAIDPDRVVVVSEELVGDPRIHAAVCILMQDLTLVGQNVKFDVEALSHLGYGLPDIGGDTMLMAHTLEESKGGKDLGSLARDHLGAPDWKGQWKAIAKGTGAKHAGEAYDLVDAAPLHRYNALDVAATARLYRLFSEKMDADDQRAHALMCRAAGMLVALEATGLRVDSAHQGVLQADLEAEIAALGETLALHVVNPASVTQIREAIAAITGKQPEDTTRATLEAMLESGQAAEFIEPLLAWRKATKLLGTYVSRFHDFVTDSGRIHPSLKLHSTITGRLSSSDPNLQNAPASVRGLFVPDPGKVFIEADLSAAEFRVIAVESQDPAALALYQDGSEGDIHTETALAFFGEAFEQAEGEERYLLRRRAKSYVFGVPYGRTAQGVAHGMGCTIDEAHEFERKFFERFPGIAKWQQAIKREVLAGRPLVTAFGRKLRTPKPGAHMSRGEQGALVRSALSFLPQSTASDICLLAATNLYYDHGRVPLMLVHDSILVQAAPEDVEETARLMVATFRDAGRQYTEQIAFEVEVSSGQRWGALEPLHWPIKDEEIDNGKKEDRPRTAAGGHPQAVRPRQ